MLTFALPFGAPKCFDDLEGVDDVMEGPFPKNDRMSFPEVPDATAFDEEAWLAEGDMMRSERDAFCHAAFGRACLVRRVSARSVLTPFS